MTKRIKEIDIEIGKRLRQFRLNRGLSQEAIAKHLGITFQQVQKYEKGHNRISASNIAKLADVLGVKMGDFFGETENITEAEGSLGNLVLMRNFNKCSRVNQRILVQISKNLAGAS